jgi:hypothetical protein
MNYYGQTVHFPNNYDNKNQDSKQKQVTYYQIISTLFFT